MKMKYRVSDYKPRRDKRARKADLKAMLKAAEDAAGTPRKEFCGNSKSRHLVMIKEAIIVVGLENGIQNRELAEALGMVP